MRTATRYLRTIGWHGGSPLVWRFRSPHHFCSQPEMPTSGPKPRQINKLLVSFDFRSSQTSCGTVMQLRNRDTLVHRPSVGGTGDGRSELSRLSAPLSPRKAVETGSPPASCDESRGGKPACGDGAHYSCLRYLSLRLRSSFLRLRPKLRMSRTPRCQTRPHRRRREGQFASARTESSASILTLGCALPTGSRCSRIHQRLRPRSAATSTLKIAMPKPCSRRFPVYGSSSWKR